jgi:hypothetical protein
MENIYMLIERRMLMFNQKRRYLIVEEADVTTVLMTVNQNQGFFSKSDMATGNCGWKEEPTKWFVRFYASDKVWGKIARELTKIGDINVHVAPGGATDLYFKRKLSSE